MDYYLSESRNSVLIIAEAGVNHNGSIDLAIELCNKAKEAGADAIKFQTWITENIITKEVVRANYQIENSGINESQFDMLKKLELSFNDFRLIKKHCDEIGIRFLSTPDDMESLDFLLSLGLGTIKIGSGEINNLPFLRNIGKKGIDIILSTGMSDILGVECAYETLRDAGAKSIALLHCTTSYPCPMIDVNLNVISALRSKFNCKIGYSDHTIGIEIAIAAVALGAEIIEKHFTLDKKFPGPDHKASIDFTELERMIKSIRNIELAMGDGIKKITATEIQNSKVVLKRIVAKQSIRKGEIFTENNLTQKRSDRGIEVSQWDNIIGKVSEKEFNINDPIL
jgi:N,N'-diacetyllegionaminate synthase